MRECYKCGERDHFPRECPNVTGGERTDAWQTEPELTCFNCDRAGHCSRECKEPRPFSGQGLDAGGGGGNQQGCFRCGEKGHISRDCKNPRQTPERINCYFCHKDGHRVRDCPDAYGERNLPASKKEKED